MFEYTFNSSTDLGEVAAWVNACAAEGWTLCSLTSCGTTCYRSDSGYPPDEYIGTEWTAAMARKAPNV